MLAFRKETKTVETVGNRIRQIHHRAKATARMKDDLPLNFPHYWNLISGGALGVT
jgi:hypothetical protein